MLTKLSKQDADAYYGSDGPPVPVPAPAPAPAAAAAGGRARPVSAVYGAAGGAPGAPTSPPPPPVELSQIIDTTLLKAYLLTGSSLVGPLVRLENQCNIGESVALLKQYKVRTQCVRACVCTYVRE
jgi:hypothetical protein